MKSIAFFLGLWFAAVLTIVGPDRLQPQTQTQVQLTHEDPAPTLTPTSSPTPTPTLTATPTPPKPTATPTPTPEPAEAYSGKEMQSFIEQYAGQYGVDPNVLRYVAVCESGLNPSAMNGPYGGLYQFSASAWNTYRTRLGADSSPGLRFDAREAVRTAAFVLSINAAFIWPNCVPS